jgi:hypothetical protein
LRQPPPARNRLGGLVAFRFERRNVFYKPNKQARQEYLKNEAKNKERNRRVYDNQKAKSKAASNARVVIGLILLALIYILLTRHR